jgi:hypothetical protein
MRYTLLMPTGRIMLFYVKGVADLYRNLYGGVVITQQVLDQEVDNSADMAYN